jgi:hypothetical protein
MTRHPERDEKKETLDRRTYLQIASGAAIVGGMAGCLGNARAQETRYGYGGERYVLDSTALDAESLNLTAESEPNDACIDANPIALDTDISGTLESAGVDWYGFDLAADTAFEVVFDRVPETGVTGVIVYGPDCDFLQLRQVGTTKSVRLAAAAAEAGTYKVQIVDVNSADGEYTVAIDTGSYDTTTPEDDYGEAGYGEAGYGGTA